MSILIAAITFWIIRFAAPRIRTRVARRKAEPAMIALRIPIARPIPAPPETLCNGCVYAHIVRGYRTGEETIACGYVFPAREVLFRVRECTDYRPKRERIRVEIANEGAVCILPLDETATDFRAVAAARDGEGEVESSYR
jgi:hypothetical protein